MGERRGATWVLLLVCALYPCFAAHRARAEGDHRLRWRTIETERFRVHYHEPLGLWARTLAAEADAVCGRLERALGLTLRQRVELVIADDNDSANGFAGAIPYNAIHLRAASPDDMSPLSDYDDWPTTLLTHEHTHVLHLEETSGIPRLLQYVFGRFYSPQNTLPGWIIEGLAVVQESAHTTGGRVRSSIFDMYMRMDALDQRVLGIDWIGFEGEPWPHGNVRYVYGQALMEFLRQRHGQAALGRFAKEYGRRLVPYGINRALERATGETFLELYAAFVEQLRARAQRVRDEVEAAGRVEGERLTFHGEMTRSPRFRSERELVYAVSDARHVPEVRTLALDPGAAPTRVVRTGNVAQVAPVRGRDRLVYSSVYYHRGVYSYSELSAVDRDGGRRERLTHALRAREPDVSPDGARVVYVTQGAGTSYLEVAELADLEHTRKLVVRSSRFEQVFTPRWSPDGRTIAYSAFEPGGYRDIWLLDLASGVRTRVTYDRALDRGPAFSPDGKTLYFSSDRTGVANIYAYDLATRTLSQVTNVVGGAFQPDVSPDGRKLVYVGYTSRGFDLYLLALDAAPARPAPPSFERAAPRPLPAPAPLLSTSYQPLQSLWPRSYDVSIEDTGSGARMIVNTRGEDVVRFHTWSLRAASQFDHAGSRLTAEDRWLEAGYAYRQPRFPVLAYGGLYDHDRDDLRVNGRWRTWHAHEGSFGLATSFAMPAPLYTVRLRLDYVASFLQKAEPFHVRLDPNYPPPRLPPLGFDTQAYWSLSYASAQRQPFDISQSWGQVLTFAGSLREPYLGSRERNWGLSLRAEQFVRFSLRESVLAFAYTAALRTSVTLGGYPSQLAPLRDAVLGVQGAPGDYARLRGFAPRRGDTLQVLQVEYRLLIVRLNRGIQTLPLFARRLHAALFVDAGDAYTGPFSLSRVGIGTGAELRLDWASDYGQDYTFRAGLARGLTAGGEFQWYTTLATPF